jgi:hypothetical protein
VAPVTLLVFGGSNSDKSTTVLLDDEGIGATVAPFAVPFAVPLPLALPFGFIKSKLLVFASWELTLGTLGTPIELSSMSNALLMLLLDEGAGAPIPGAGGGGTGGGASIISFENGVGVGLGHVAGTGGGTCGTEGTAFTVLPTDASKKSNVVTGAMVDGADVVVAGLVLATVMPENKSTLPFAGWDGLRAPSDTLSSCGPL